MAKHKPAKSAAKPKKSAPAKAVKSAKKPAAKSAKAVKTVKAPSKAPAKAPVKAAKPEAKVNGAGAKAAHPPGKPNGKPAKPVALTPFLKKQQEKLLQLRDSMLDAMMGVAKDNLRTRAEGSE